MSLNDRVMPFLTAAFGNVATVRPGNPSHFLVTQPFPSEGRPSRMAREIVVQIERDLEREIVHATEFQMSEVIGPSIQRAIPMKLLDYRPDVDGAFPFLVILGMESIGL